MFFPLKLSNFLTYGVGQVGGQILRDVPAVLLLFFMTDTLGIPAGTAGWVVLTPKLWVLFADPLVGHFSDRARTRLGPRRPFLFAGVLIAAPSFIALFIVPAFFASWRASVVFFLYVLLSTGFSIFSVPYLTIASEMSADPVERTKALGFRQVFSLAGVLLGAGGAPVLVAYFGGGPQGYRGMGLVLGAVIFSSIMITACTSSRRIGSLESDGAAGLGLLSQLGAAWVSKPIRILISAFACQLIAFGAANACFAYYVVHVLKLPLASLGGLTLASAATGALAPLFWAPMAGRVGRLKTYRIASFCHAIVMAMFLLPQPGGLVGVTIAALFLGVTSSGFTMTSAALLTDVIQRDRLTSGQSRAGVFSAIYSATEKASFAIGAFLIAWVLSAAGFVESMNASTAQPESAIHAILYAFVGIPAVMMLVSVWILGLYPKITGGGP